MDLMHMNFLFEENPNPMLIYDPSDLSIKDVNNAALDLYGYTKDEMLSINIADLRPESELPILKKELSKQYNKFNKTGTWIHCKKNGDLIFVRVLSHLVSDGDKNYKLVSIQDVTVETEYHQELQMFLESSLDGIMITSPDGSIHKANNAACEMLGMDEAEIIALGRDGLVYKDQKLQQALERREETGGFSGELTFIHKSGEKIPVELTTSVYTTPQGEARTSMVIRDITERKQTEQQLEESLKRYHYVTKATNEAIYDWDIKHDQLQFGEAFRELIDPDIDPNNLTLEKFDQFIHPEDLNGVRQSLNQTRADPTKNSWNHEYRFKKPSGKYVQIIENAYIIRNKEGSPVRKVGAIRDITEEQELRRQLDHAYQMARIGVWELDLQKPKLTWSPMTKELHEVPPDFEPDLETAINFYAPGKSRKMTKNLVNKAIEEGVSYDEELQIITAKGQKKWVRAKGKPEFVEGKCQRIYGIFQDIHERKEAQLKKIKALKEQDRILERITEGFFAVDQNWTVTYWNKSAEEIIGIARSEVLNQNLWDTFPEAKELTFFQEYKRAFDLQEAVSFEEYYPPHNVWLEVNAYPSEDGLSVFFRNVTTRKIQEQNLEDSLKEKETLLMEIHHRVKNNLAVVSGLMQLQAFNSDDESLRQKLNDSVNRIKTMASIHELLYKSNSFSRLDTDDIIQKLVSEIIQSFGSETTLNTKFELQSIELNINQAIPLSLIINEVVTNILKHAFTGRDQGMLAAFISESNQKVHLQIIDNGKGLPKGFPNDVKTDSLGIQLIDTLSNQLEADYSYQTVDEETHFNLTFQKADIKGTGSALI